MQSKRKNLFQAKTKTWQAGPALRNYEILRKKFPPSPLYPPKNAIQNSEIAFEKKTRSDISPSPFPYDPNKVYDKVQQIKWFVWKSKCGH